MTYNVVKKHRCFSGDTLFCEHESVATKTNMKFSAFVPDKELDSAIIWLSGLTCTDENFIAKAGAQRYLAGTNTMIICPDTSPRGLDLPGEHETYDFGSGAGFYVNATTEHYRDHYQMYDYIVKDIVGVLKSDFKVENVSIMGHSMGGHGALVIGLRENDLFSAVSAFSPIVNPMECAWGQKALTGYLGEDRGAWSEYDGCELIKCGKKSKKPILVEQGLADEFLEEQLLTDNFKKACAESGQELQLSYQEGYDHSYYFISTFIEKHIAFHLKALS